MGKVPLHRKAVLFFAYVIAPLIERSVGAIIRGVVAAVVGPAFRSRK